MGQEWIIAGLGAAQWLVSFRLLARLAVPPAPGAGGGVAAGEVSVIIPARNEAANLPRLLESIKEQEVQPLEVLVVDDDSDDGTADVARAFGATVITSRELPPDWRGKPWACSQGADSANGRLLMFLDADCRFEPGGLKAILERYPGGAFAVCPYHSVRSAYEQLSAFFNIVMVGSTAPAGLFGQCLLIDRSTYRDAGGYSAVKSEILENVKFAACIRAAGAGTSGIPGRGMIAFRMYPDGLASLVEGWTKGFAAGAAATSRGTLLLVSVWIGGLVLGIAAPWVAPWGWAVYLAFAFQCLLMLRRVGNFSPFAGLFYPVLLAFYLIVFLRALGPAGRKAKWKGRSLHV